MVELHPNGKNEATFWADSPVDVTVVQDEGDLDWYLVRLNRAVNTPNGKLSFLGLVRGLPVVRSRAIEQRGEKGCELVTRKHSVIRVLPAPGWCRLDALLEQAELYLSHENATVKQSAALVCPLQKTEPAAAVAASQAELADLAGWLTKRIGRQVAVRYSEEGNYVISGAGDLDEEGATRLVAEWVRESKNGEKPVIDWSLSSYLAAKFGGYIEVAFYRDGSYTLNTELTDRQAINAHILLYIDRNKEENDGRG